MNDFLRASKLPVKKVLVTVNGHWVCTTAWKTKVWPHLSPSTGKAVADGKELASSESATEDEEFATICWGQMNQVSESLNGIKWDVIHPLVYLFIEISIHFVSESWLCWFSSLAHCGLFYENFWDWILYSQTCLHYLNEN